jgi:hypothetical protein
MSRLLDVLTIAGLIAAGVLVVYLAVEVALDPAACFGSCS